MNRCICLSLARFLWIGVIAILPHTVRGHFFWAETNGADQPDRVTVTFSENAGVPDKVIAIMEHRVTRMAYTVGDSTVDVALALNEEKTVLEGDLPRSFLVGHGGDNHQHNNDGPALVSGYLDFGSFEKFHDLEYSFAAQVYSSNADYDAFFRPLLTNDTPSIVMRNCGGSSSKGTSYQFDVGGFPSEGPVSVCIYRKGGLKMGCGEFSVPGEQHEDEEHFDLAPGEIATSLGRSRSRNLLRGEKRDFDAKTDLSIELSPSIFLEQNEDEAPYLLYAIANKTRTDEASGEISIAFASTSVYFEGPCQELS